jgi:uncharacterized damage-inducible protein DinB
MDTYLAYDRWANRRLLQAARALQVEEFSKDLHASFGSIRGAVLHILWGEWGSSSRRHGTGRLNQRLLLAGPGELRTRSAGRLAALSRRVREYDKA